MACCISELQHALGRPTWEELISTHYSSFLARFQYLPEDSLVRHLQCFHAQGRNPDDSGLFIDKTDEMH